MVRRLLADHVPLVLFSADIRMMESNSVTVDDYKGGYQATEYLLSLGHRRLGIISDNLPGSKLRVEGFMDALKAAGVGFGNPANLTHTSATLENGRKAAAAMLAQAQEGQADRHIRLQRSARDWDIEGGAQRRLVNSP